ncbi:MAG: PQQ-binding-like beta-propeller repeat protein [Planctomycetes bacterium]|nr:PQQ-binding-like beta-propeller repeat protein [Planctomycetota bacterium]
MNDCTRSPRVTTWSVICVATAVLFCTLCGTAAADDWPQWGGPQRDLVWRETGIVETLPQTNADGVLPRMWSTPLGEGYAGPAVADGRVYVMDRQFEKQTERVLCLNAASGEPLWTHEYEARYEISYPAGPRSTPLIDDGRVYAIGAMGHMFCLAADDGRVVWQKNFVEDYATPIPTWGMVATPLVDGQQLITLVGGESGALVVSFDKQTGRELWRALDDPQVGYAPPVIFEFGDRRVLIVWHPEAVSALDPASGKRLWEIPFRVQAGLTIATPRKHGNRLFVTAFYNGPRMIEVSDDGTSAEIVWKGDSNSERQTDGLHSIISTPVFTGDHIYGVCSYGQLRCLDAKTGERVWETFEATGEGRWWNAFLVPHEPSGKHFLHNEQGDLIVADLSPEGYRELSRAKLVEPTRKVQRRMTIWSQPAFAMKSVFARNDEEIVRVNLSADQP